MATSDVPNRYSLTRLDDENYTTCETYSTNFLYSGGIPFGDKYDNTNVVPIFMLQVILAFFTSRLVYFVLRPLKQPDFVCNVLSGIILGPSGLGRSKSFLDAVFPSREMVVVNSLSMLGGIYFIFIITVKMDLTGTLRMAKNAWKVGATCLLVPLTITMCLSCFLSSHLPGITGGVLFLLTFSCGLSQTYFPVIVHAIGELNLLTSELGQLAVSFAMLHEVAGWFNITVVTLFSGGDKVVIIKTELSMFALILFTIFVVRPAMRWIIKRAPEGKPVQQVYIIAVLLGPLIMGFLSESIGSSFVWGALLMGLTIPAGPPLGSTLVQKCELVISNLFVPFFYVRIGQLTNVYSITDWQAFASLEFVILASYLGKTAASLVAFIWFKRSLRNAILFSFILNIKGIFDLIVISLWASNELIDQQSFTTLVLSHTAVTAIVTPLLSIYYRPQIRLEKSAMIKYGRRTLQGMPLCIELRILFCVHYEDNVHSIITMLEASNATERSQIRAYIVHLVELAGRAAPSLGSYHSKRSNTKTNPTDRIMRALIKYSESSSAGITIQPYTMIAPINDMHQSICRLARDKYIPFIILPYHQSQEADQRTARLRNFDINVQACAPCTVGIFLDRSSLSYLKTPQFSYHVAIFFLGGPDDREAMALVSRMSHHPTMKITVVRIDLRGYHQEENKLERQLDDCVINEFMAGNIGNTNVVCRELKAKDTMQVMEAIRSVESYYDLVIVGKRRSISSLEKEMMPWVEYEELGVIGDMLASVDFYSGILSVLVIQCVAKVSENMLSGNKDDVREDRRSHNPSSRTNCDREDKVDAGLCTEV